MRPGDDRHRNQGAPGGVPDGLIVGLLAFLLGMTVLVWTGTGLAALFAHGAWPSGVTFSATPLAIRHLAAQPHDIPGAWPDTDPGALSGYGLFWGLLISQLMVLIVLTVFVMGTLARWRAVRAARRTERTQRPSEAPAAPTTPHEVPTPRTEALAPRPETPTPTPTPEPLPAPAVVPPAASAAPAFTKADPPEPQEPAPTFTPAATVVTTPPPTVVYAAPATRVATATQAVQDAEGAVLVVTSAPALWQATKDARAKLGPVLLYDPTHLCDTPARLHWSPVAGCEDRPTAAARATALLAAVRPTARLDQAVGDTAETLLRSYLHAAAVDGRTVRHVHRWSQGSGVQDAVRVLRTHPKAAPGSAGELEAALTAHPERRDIAQELTTRALAALSMVNIREACTPHRTDTLTLDSFVNEGGTLYVVGASIEDPRTEPGAMPLLTALVSSVVERGRGVAERSSSGRLDPPLTLILDDVAAVAPLPQLPDLVSDGAARGLPTLALLRSREQARSRWPDHDLPA
ncbi:type VI secretion protein [Streptomyces sp. NPDC058417]|uniref:type VI secretion protein n=1 Tax=unclassified Streptomyces TaxID=2593676 RepID=UPI0036602475